MRSYPLLVSNSAVSQICYMRQHVKPPHWRTSVKAVALRHPRPGHSANDTLASESIEQPFDCRATRRLTSYSRAIQTWSLPGRVLPSKALRRRGAVIEPLAWWCLRGTDGEHPASYRLPVGLPGLTVFADVHHDAVLGGKALSCEITSRLSRSGW